MGKSTKTNSVLTIEAEEIPLEETIKQELVKHNITEAVISGLKEKYGDLKLRSIDDKEGYLNIKDAKKEVRRWGILTEKLTKAGREDAIKIQKLWLSKEKEILSKIAEVEDPLQAEIDKYEENISRIEQEKIRQKEDAFIQRQSDLSKMGAVYANGCFNLNDVSFESNVVKESDQDIWENSILPKFRVQFEKNESMRLQEQMRREEETARLQQERESLEKQQRELREQQEALRVQQEESTRQQRLIQQQAEEERSRVMREKLQSRGNQLAGLGMTFNFQHDCYVFQDVNVDNKTEICLFNDAQWGELVGKITPVIEQRKKEAEEKRLARIEEEKRIAVEQGQQRERERIAEEQRQAKLKEEQESVRLAEEELKATDKEKWATYVTRVTGIAIPEMRHPAYKNRALEVKKLLQKITQL